MSPLEMTEALERKRRVIELRLSNPDNSYYWFCLACNAAIDPMTAQLWHVDSEAHMYNLELYYLGTDEVING